MTEPRLIPLHARDGSVRAYVLVDVEDYERVCDMRWTLAANGYAVHSVQQRNEITQTYMHRLLLGLEPGDPRQADHLNRNRLDNRRGNLRIVTSSENSQNLSPRANTSSRHRGVWWHAQRGYWVAATQINGRKHHIGVFASEDEAGAAAAAFRARHMPLTVEEVA